MALGGTEGAWLSLGSGQAIELSSEALSNVKFIQEKKVIQKYFDEISQAC